MESHDPNTVAPNGKTYAEIDAEQEVYVASANAALDSLRSVGARWWKYSAGHHVFELLVGDSSGRGNLVIALSACEWIAGPVSWPNRNVRVRWRNNRTSGGGWDFVVEDTEVGFEARAPDFMWAQDYDIYERGSLYCPRRRP